MESAITALEEAFGREVGRMVDTIDAITGCTVYTGPAIGCVDPLVAVEDGPLVTAVDTNLIVQTFRADAHGGWMYADNVRVERAIQDYIEARQLDAALLMTERAGAFMEDMERARSWVDISRVDGEGVLVREIDTARMRAAYAGIWRVEDCEGGVRVSARGREFVIRGRVIEFAGFDSEYELHLYAGWVRAMLRHLYK